MEATVVCVDNSEWTRNGDYAPTRFQAQADAVNLLAGAKTQANPENTVGVLTMAGKTPRVLVTPTPDLGKILNSMQNLAIEGETNMASAVQIAQLALKHRQNKNQRQRIVIFIGSPIKEDKEALVRIAKKLKKSNVAVDIVSFGCEQENDEQLEAFISAVNNNDNSNLVQVPSGTVLSDMLFGSPIFQADGGSGYGMAAPTGGGDGFEFGVDPNIDPELALALRVSLEEERARQSAAAAATLPGPEAASDSVPVAPAARGAEGSEPVAPKAGDVDDMALDDDALLQQALAMSMQVDAPSGEGVVRMSVDASDDELQKALEMSMQTDSAAPAQSGVLMDEAYVNSVLGSLPGVDPNDPVIQSALRSLQRQSDQESRKDEENASEDPKKGSGNGN